MDSYEASRTVFSRIQSLEPESASKIMGYLLIQDYGEKEMIRLAFGPETLLQSLIFKAKSHLGLLTKSLPSPNSTPSFNPISRPSPLSIPSSNAWPVSGFSDSQISNPSLSYASVLNRTSSSASTNTNNTSSGSLSSFSSPYNSTADLVEEFQLHADDVYDKSPQWGSNPLVLSPSACFGSDDLNSGFGFRPCLYFQRGFCKNGNTCRFVHNDSIGESIACGLGSPSNNLNELEQCQELLRLKAAQQQKLASATHFMAGSSFPYDNKSVNLLMQQQIDPQRSSTGSMIMGDELHKFGRFRFDRNEIVSPSSRQIYLTFPADSTFREEDVSNYFSIYGPVQDVRIPYQQKRMFGFVTFVYPETVKLILAKGNPHFVCDSRVLVKPYKEKGKIVEKKQQHQQQQQQQSQQFENGDYSLCSSPSGLDYDVHHGPRMFYNTQEMLSMKKLEERANFEQAIELHGRKLMNLQLVDLKNQQYHRHGQYHRSLSMGSSIPSPTALPYSPTNQVLVVPSQGTNQEDLEETNGRSTMAVSPNTGSDANSEINNGTSKVYAKTEEIDLNESIEHILPDNLFGSPKKSATADHTTAFSTPSEDTSEISNASLLSNSTLNIASPKSVFSKCSGFLLGMEPLECN